MLKKTDSGLHGSVMTTRIVPLDRARTFITLLVVLHHSAINYTHFGVGGDRMRWLGFDLIVLFNDSFFMACMFFISGLFVCDSLERRKSRYFLASRVWRLGLPYLVSVFAVMPIAYYRYHFTEVDFFGFYRQMVTVGPWSSGSSWFLWVLLVLDAIIGLAWTVMSRFIRGLGRLIFGLGDRPFSAFAAFALFSIVIYLPLHLIFGDSAWLVPGHLPLPIQTSRILLYAGYFTIGVCVGSINPRTGVLTEEGAFAQRWLVWIALALALYGVILFLVYVHRSGLVDLRSPPLWWHTAYGVAFALFNASMTFALPIVFLRFARSNVWFLDAMQPSAYGMYLLHFIPLIWLQYLVYGPAFPAFVKFTIVFAGTLSVSWVITIRLRKMRAVARVI